MMFFAKFVFGQKVFFSTGDWVSWEKVVKKEKAIISLWEFADVS